MKIKGYLKTSLIEWPGKVSSVVYTSGCNFRCPFCHNRDLVDPERILRLQDISEQSIFNDLKQRKKWVDAVVISGGEPTLQRDLRRFLSRLKWMGFLTMVETNGSRPEIIAGLLHSHTIDRFAMDIKGPLDKQYARISNLQFPISKIEESIKLILESKIEFEFRTTVVPGIHDEKVLMEMAKHLADYSQPTLRLSFDNAQDKRSGQATHPSAFLRQRSGLTFRASNLQPVWILQNFQPKNCLNPAFEKIKPYPGDKLKELLATVVKIFPGVILR